MYLYSFLCVVTKSDHAAGLEVLVQDKKSLKIKKTEVERLPGTDVVRLTGFIASCERYPVAPAAGRNQLDWKSGASFFRNHVLFLIGKKLTACRYLLYLYSRRLKNVSHQTA